MANVTQSLFGFTPQDLQEQRRAELDKRAAAFAQLDPMQQAQAGLYRAGSMFGDAAASALGYEDPEMAQARARQGLLGGMDINDPKALRDAAKSTNDPQVQLFLADRALEIEKAIAEANRKKQGGSGVGTGVERMIQHIVKVEEDEAAGNQVSVADKNKAKYFRMQLSQVKTYKMPDDTIITISVKDFTGQQDAEAAGGVPVDVQAMLPVSGTTPSTSPPTTTTAPTTGQKTPGVRVTETPASQAAKEKAEEGKRQKQVVFESDIGQIDKALEIVRSKGRLAAGAGSLLSFIPESSASELADTIQSIDAGKLINQIESLKTTSPSGATGFGSLTEQEGQRLINRLGSIKQTKSPQKLEEALLEVRTLLGKLAGKELPPPRGSSQSVNANQEAVIKKLMDANPGKTRESIIQFAKSKKLI